MLAPNLYKWFPPPIQKTYKEGKFTDEFSFLEKNVSDHYFNFSVSVLFPDSLFVPTLLREEFARDSIYYLLKAVPLYSFVSLEFLDFFIKCGEITMLSVNTRLDLDDSVAITPCGRLVLSLNKQTFQKLGIVQGPSIEVRGKGEKTFVLVNLCGDSFSKGKRNYDRLYRSFKESKILFDVIITWEPNDSSICPSSLAYFFNKINVDVAECSVKETTSSFYNIKFPSFKTSDDELFEWFGVMLLGLSPPDDDPVEEYVSSLKEPEFTEEVGRIAVATFTGLMTRNKLLRILTLFREMSKTCESDYWVGLHVQGFEDSPTSWALTPHHFHTSGDNSYSILLSPNDDFRFCKVLTEKIKNR